MHRMWSHERDDCRPGWFRLQSVTPKGVLLVFYRGYW
jgi:hypothetical protein